MQQELAEIFEQELDQMANRYETANQASEQQNDREVDELLREAEGTGAATGAGSRAPAAAGAAGSGRRQCGGAQQRGRAGGRSRRRRRATRAKSNGPSCRKRRVRREAADAMRRAAAGGGAGAEAQAQAALERLRETEKRLQRSLTQRAERDIADARRDAEDRTAAAGNRRSGSSAGGQSVCAGADRAPDQREEDQLEERLGKLESNLDEAARDASREERPASRKMAEAAGAIRDNRLRDAVRYSKALVSRGSNQQANAAEADLARDRRDAPAPRRGAGRARSGCTWR